jgi:hypothetical protein
MQNPVIIQFDEDDSYFMVVEMICFNLGLTLQKTASSIDGARAIIKEIEAKKIKPDIAIIASYLGYDFSDGEKLAVKLKEIAPEIKIIAYSTDPETNWGDFLAVKSGLDQSKSLVNILCEITGKEFKASNIKESE